MWTVIFLIYIGTVCVVAAYSSCTSFSNLPLTGNSRMDGAMVLSVVTNGVLGCAKECGTRSVCKSFNFNLDSQLCEINMASEPNVTSAIQIRTMDLFVFSQADNWQNLVYGPCKNYLCPDNSKCAETESGGAQCVITHCTSPPSVPNSELATTPDHMTQVNQSLDVVCHVGYVPCGNVTCTPDGSWTNMTCSPVSSCADLQHLCASYTDGEYWLYPINFGGVRIKVYCHGMTSTPEEFISLPTPYFMDAPKLEDLDCDGQEVERSDDMLGYNVYTKFGLKINTMEINKKERSFYNQTSLFHANVGVVRDCYSRANSACGPMGHLVMDLRGTGLALNETITWSTAYGAYIWEPIVSRSHSDQLMDVRCGGDCGVCSAPGPMLLKYAETDIVPEQAATVPKCDL